MSFVLSRKISKNIYSKYIFAFFIFNKKLKHIIIFNIFA